MSDNSQQERRDENNNNNNNNNATNDSGSSSSYLSTIMQPMFHNSNSSQPLSRFLTSPFVFSVRTVSLIDQSVKGYFQFAHFKKNEKQLLDLLPLEKVDEYYFPEEIEEEIIVPSTFPGSLRRKVTSSWHSPPPSPSPHLGQRSEKMSAAPVVGDAVRNADSFGKAPPKVNLGRQRQSQTESPQYVSENVGHRKKSQVDTPSKEVNQPDLGGSNNNSSNKQSPQFITEADKYPSEKLAADFRSKAKNLPRAEDQSNIKKSPSASKVDSGVIVSSERPQLFPWKKGEPARLSSSPSSPSISASEDNTSSMRLNESKPASNSSGSQKSKVIADDADNNYPGPESEQFTNIITKGIFQPSSSSDSSQSIHSSNSSSSSSIKPNVKIPIESNSNNDYTVGRSETHIGEDSNNPENKPIHMESIMQSKEIVTPADKSLNLPNISESAQDSSFALMRSKDITMNTSFASTTRTTSTTAIDDNQNIIKPYNLLSKTSLSDGKQKPTITINKLEVHVVGSNNNNVQRPMLNRSLEIADSPRHKLDDEDLQVNTETLNKSYLWKHKVRLS